MTFLVILVIEDRYVSYKNDLGNLTSILDDVINYLPFDKSFEKEKYSINNQITLVLLSLTLDAKLMLIKSLKKLTYKIIERKADIFVCFAKTVTKYIDRILIEAVLNVNFFAPDFTAETKITENSAIINVHHRNNPLLNVCRFYLWTVDKFDLIILSIKNKL
ncbi:hypothetical protein BpHYR1_029857 [Brachionus plicatilis]|uniref:Uncharacterized protein n=1 Tax=Brachionus plicatilis TaxID=10195 RepID=A0A3M7PFG9_BRAPC|nr:hypothetical protein BpHYR1_029857 [Brachionus plicatilis]